jgi:hypothetical protein
MEKARSANLKRSFCSKPAPSFTDKAAQMNKILNVEDSIRATRTAYSRDNTFLHPNHLQLLQNSSISPEVSRARGYQTITTRSALKGYGFGAEQCRPPALLIPIYDGRGKLTTYQIRSDYPRIDRHAGAVDYEVCPGRQFALDAPPSCASMLSDPRIPIYLTDEVFKADSAASQGLCCLALVGLLQTLDEYNVERWISLSDWNDILLDNRLVRFVYDADSADRPATRSAFANMQEFPWSRHARIQRISL